MHAQHTAVREQRRCSRCQASKPPGAFYRNPASICKACHNAATRLAGEVRRAALAQLVTAHQAEYRRLLAAERARRVAIPKPVDGWGGEAA
jgi:recombinational DNA repair protein (RecF pathway)